jgi:succinoglycan biosynthesis transport protein ExoP
VTEKLPQRPDLRPSSMQFFAEVDPNLAGPRLAYRPAPPAPEDEIGLEDVWRMLRRQWWVILASFVVVVAATYLYTARQIPVWQASALIRVETGEASPTAALFGDMGGDTWIETEMLVVETRPVLSVVVEDLSLNFRVLEPADIPRHFLFTHIDADRFTPSAVYDVTRLSQDSYRIEPRTPSGSWAARDFRAGEVVSIPGSGFAVAPDSIMLSSGVAQIPERMVIQTVGFDGAVAGLQGTLEVTRPDDWASIFGLTFKGTDRWLVRNVVNGTAEAFINQRRGIQKIEARSRVAFLREQSDQIQVELEAAEDALQAFREGQQVVALASEAQQQIQLLVGMQADRMSLAAERDGLSNLLREVQSTGGATPDYTRLVAFPTFLQNATFQNLVQSLTDAERSRAELRARWTENHPGVLALDEQIALLKARLGDIGQNYLQSLNTQIATLDATLVRFGSDLEEIPARELQYARLERQSEMLASIYGSLQQNLKEWEVTEAVEDGSVRVVEHAVLPGGPVSPRPGRNLALGSFLGLMLGLGLAFSRQMIDRTLRHDDDVGQMLGLSVLSRVPRLPEASAKSPRSKALVTLHAGRSLSAEAYRTLRSSIFFTDVEGNGKRELVVTSPGARDGKSVTSCNLAITFAQQGYKTLLIDGDLRRSTLHLTFGIEEEDGLTEYLQGDVPLNALLRDTKVPNLYVVPAGRTPANPSELLGSPKFDDLLRKAREVFDTIVVDSPPVLVVTDAAVLANKLDGVVLVVRSDKTHRRAAENALEQLRLVGARVLGVVINDADEGGRYGYGYSDYFKYYGPEEGRKTEKREREVKGPEMP